MMSGSRSDGGRWQVEFLSFLVTFPLYSPRFVLHWNEDDGCSQAAAWSLGYVHVQYLSCAFHIKVYDDANTQDIVCSAVVTTESFHQSVNQLVCLYGSLKAGLKQVYVSNNSFWEFTLFI